MKLDRFDVRILEAVQANGRITKLALAEAVGLSPTPCWVRLRKLEAAGIITGYHARLAPRRLAPMTCVIMEVTLISHRQQDFERFEAAVAATPEITTCWSVGGGVDYFLYVMTPDIDTYQRLVDRFLAQEIGINRYFTYIVTKTVKEETSRPLSLPAAGEEV